jgi:hypothetical protein
MLVYEVPLFPNRGSHNFYRHVKINPVGSEGLEDYLSKQVMADRL